MKRSSGKALSPCPGLCPSLSQARGRAAFCAEWMGTREAQAPRPQAGLSWQLAVRIADPSQSCLPLGPHLLALVFLSSLTPLLLSRCPESTCSSLAGMLCHPTTPLPPGLCICSSPVQDGLSPTFPRECLILSLSLHLTPQMWGSVSGSVSPGNGLLEGRGRSCGPRA